MLFTVSCFRPMFTFLALKQNTKVWSKLLIANMGGHALKNTNVSRVDLKTLSAVKSTVKEKLSLYVDVDFPNERPGKMDFGDIDVLYQPKFETTNMKQVVDELFESPEVVRNGDVLSFAYHLQESDKYVQVDLIKVKDMEMAKFYFSYGDCGNLVGAVTHHYGIKFGFEGLFLVPSRETISKFDGTKLSLEVTSRIVLSTKPDEICRFLGLDYNNWKQFERGSTSDIFDWIKSSRLFYNGIFAVNHKHRKKLDTRPMYSDFVSTCDSEDVAIISKNLRDAEQLAAIAYFKKDQDLCDAIARAKQLERRRDLFSARRFMAHGLTGRALGGAIVEFKQHMETKFGLEFDEWLDSIAKGSEHVVDAEVDLFCSEREGITRSSGGIVESV